MDKQCRNCGSTGWVCENHEDRPWGGLSDDPVACECGAGSPCPVCQREMACAPGIDQGLTEIEDGIWAYREQLAALFRESTHADRERGATYYGNEARLANGDVLLVGETHDAVEIEVIRGRKKQRLILDPDTSDFLAAQLGIISKFRRQRAAQHLKENPHDAQ